MLNDLVNNALFALNGFAKAVDKFDFDSAFDSFNKKIDDSFNKLADYATNVRNNLSDLKVYVPFDKNNDTLAWKVEGDVLTITSTSHDGTVKSSVSTTIPENAKIDKMYKKYNKKTNVVTFTIPKEKTIEALKDEKVKKLLADYEDKISSLQTKLKKEIEKIQNSDKVEDKTEK
jgi:hypothetical protein